MTLYLILAAALIFALIYAVRFLIIKSGRHIYRFIKSVAMSVGEAISHNLEVRKILNRYPRFFAFLKARVSRQSFQGLPLTLLSVGFAYLLLLLGGVTEDVLNSEIIASADLRIANLLAYFRTPEMVKIFLWITVLGKTQVIIAFALVVSLILWLRGLRRYIGYLWVALAGEGIIAYLGKLLVHRMRPINPVYIENSFSFPSGHAMVAVVFYGFLSYILIRNLSGWRQKVNVFFASLTLILVIGFSRLYLGVHYLSDVWGGYLLGFLILVTSTTIFEWRGFKKGFWANRDRQSALPKKIRLVTAGLVSLCAIIYVFFAWSFRPPLFLPITPPAQEIVGNIDNYFSENNISKYSETLIGTAQEPLGFIFLAKDDNDLLGAFASAGWYPADRISFGSMAQIAAAAFSKKQYLKAPMTPSFWEARVNDFGFEKPTAADNVRERHHIRIWKTGFTQTGLAVYVGTASLDTGIKWFITHQISPDIDTEKAYVADGLRSQGVIASEREAQFVSPVLGKNFSNDAFFTSGKIYIIRLKWI